MLAKLRPRSAYDVMAALALFLVVAGGSAYAVNEWTGANVVDESLTGADVRGKAVAGATPAVNGSLTTHDIAGQQANSASGTPFVDGTLTQWDIKNGSVTGSDVVESSLAKVSDADKLDGKYSTQLSPASGDGRTADVELGAIQTVLSANITTAGSGTLIASAAVELDASDPSPATCRLRFDGTIESVQYTTTVPDSPFQATAASLAVVWAQSVGAGAHTVELRCNAALGGVTLDNAGLIVSAHP